MPAPTPTSSTAFDVTIAGRQLLEVYRGLAERGEHLLDQLLGGHPPIQWEHYPGEDARDPTSGYQWFYHSHDPHDRPGSFEHGHVHLFARSGEKSGEAGASQLVHLLAIGFDAKGLPLNIFTVNGWVTGARMVGAADTIRLISALRLDTGFGHLDRVIEAICRIASMEIVALMDRRDDVLGRSTSEYPLDDPSLEILSELAFRFDGEPAI